MHSMFEGATSFDQPLDRWNIAAVTDMNEMFIGAKAFSHYPKGWIVPAHDAREMFGGTKVEAESKKSPLNVKGELIHMR